MVKTRYGILGKLKEGEGTRGGDASWIASNSRDVERELDLPMEIVKGDQKKIREKKRRGKERNS